MQLAIRTSCMRSWIIGHTSDKRKWNGVFAPLESNNFTPQKKRGCCRRKKNKEWSQETQWRIAFLFFLLFFLFMILTNSNEKRKSWLFGWFSHLTTTHHQRQPPFPPPRPQANRHNNNDWRTVDDNSTPMSRTASNSSTRTGGAEDFATYSPRQRFSFPPLTAPGTPERRNSQQTTTSSIMSDDQYSSSSCHRRNSNERSILSELWSKARRHHPHYPRFHWPPRRHHHHICHCQRHESSFFVDQQAHSVGGTPRRSHDDPVGYEDELIPPNQLQQKRHSITSLVSSGSHPTSLFGSQPESPAFHPTKEQQQEDEDAVVVAEPCRPRRPNEPFERWTVAPELVRLAFDDQ